MRRFALILAASLAALVALSPAAAAAEGPILEVEFELHEDGFLVAVKSEAGGDKIALTLDRHGEVAYYETPGEVTEDAVKARFGRFGELDYTFTPAPHAGPCSEVAAGTFEGTFDFTGENEYVEFEAPSARGTLRGAPEKGCRDGRRATAAPRRPAAEATREAVEDQASLLGHSAPPWPIRSLLVVEFEAKHRQRVLFDAFRGERVEGMLIGRGAQAVAPRRDFTWNLKAGTARVAPPAPFTGSATFKRRAGGRSVWQGSLRAPVLGAGPMRLTGGDFRVQLLNGSPLG
jgi:hypothetical protein